MTDKIIAPYYLSAHAEDAIRIREIEVEWVNSTINEYDLKHEISEKEVHYFKRIENKCFKVVINPKFHRIVTLYFDRQMNKRGCQ